MRFLWLDFCQLLVKVRSLFGVIALRNKGGFTLVELMVVLAIFGALAAVAVPIYQYYMAKAQISEALSLSQGVRTQIVATVMSGKGDFGGLDSGTNGLPPAVEVRGAYVSEISVIDGVITIAMGNDASQFIFGQTVTLTPTIPAAGVVTWECSFSGKSEFVPMTCR